MFRCPNCQDRLEIVESNGISSCRGCGWVVGADGILDLAPQSTERAFYEREYSGVVEPVDDLQALWDNPYYPMNKIVLRRVGELADKTVLLLGQGTEPKELLFLNQAPRELVVSDLTAGALRALRSTYPALTRDVTFATMDALALPLVDKSVDLIYGYAFVHHLPDRDRFLAEAVRVLRPGGRAVFMDDAYAPLWQGLKVGLLRPLMKIAHRRNPRSPEDIRATLLGGFVEEDLAQTLRALGAEPWFERTGFVHYLATRGGECVLPHSLQLYGHDRLLRALIALDRRLERIPLVQANLIRLVWGFTV